MKLKPETDSGGKMLMVDTGDGGLDGKTRKKSMDCINADGMGYAAMTGIGDAYIPAAAVALGADNFYIGLLAALPQFIGALLQFGSLNALRFFKDRRALVLTGSFLQALCWLPIIGLLLWPGGLSVPLIIFFFSLGAAISLMINPIWSSWVGDIVPENERARFFANRNRLMQLVLFAATFATGLILHELSLGLGAAAAFAVMFVLPFLSRLSTVFFNSKVSNVAYDLQLVREIRLKHLFQLPAYKNELWFLIFMALVNFTVQFASPFFTPYMLENLGFDVGLLGIMTAASIAAKILSYPYWGKAIDRFGNRAVLVSTAFAMVFVPILWLFTADPAWLIAFQVFSGFAWSGLDLASFNFALSMVGRELRPSFISKYNAFNGVFYAAGSIAGGLFLVMFGSASFLGFSGILLVFLISGALRLAAVLAFAPKLSTSREPENTTDRRGMVFNLIAVYPTQGAVHQVVNGWNFTKKAMAAESAKGGRALASGLGATGEFLKIGGRKIASGIAKKRKL